jgi:hypothetical protein
VLRVAARRLIDLEKQAPETGCTEAGCEHCGVPLVRPPPGGAGGFCWDAHRRKAVENAILIGEVIAHVDR